MKPTKFLLAALITSLSGLAGLADSSAAHAINALGIDLLRQTATAHDNALLSPYSIQIAMAMTTAGADGATRDEMVRVLHYPAPEKSMDQSFAALQSQLTGLVQRQALRAEAQKKYGVTNQPLTLIAANRLYGQQGYAFRQEFTSLLQDNYLAPFEPVDFIGHAAAVTLEINKWVSDQTQQRIRELIPPGALNRATRLVLVNAIYLKAPWNEAFNPQATQSQPFHGLTDPMARVPTMMLNHTLGFAHQNGCQVLTIPYIGSELQLVLWLPDKVDGLPALTAALSPEMLAAAAELPEAPVTLYLPKFKMEPPLLSLAKAFKALGMTTAFNEPKGSANFDRMAPRRPDDYLYISDIFHKTFLTLDESGTEAAAATAVIMATPMAFIQRPAPPVVVRVDHPFLFAIQHRASGACLFLGQMTDPR